jgi:hypothetical protein
MEFYFIAGECATSWTIHVPWFLVPGSRSRENRWGCSLVSWHTWLLCSYIWCMSLSYIIISSEVFILILIADIPFVLNSKSKTKRFIFTVKAQQFINIIVLWCWNMDASGSRSETPGKFWNVVLEKDGDQLDRSREKWRSVSLWIVNQLDALNFSNIFICLSLSTCFGHYVPIIRRDPIALTQHVESDRQINIFEKFSASSWFSIHKLTQDARATKY